MDFAKLWACSHFSAGYETVTNQFLNQDVWPTLVILLKCYAHTNINIIDVIRNVYLGRYDDQFLFSCCLKRHLFFACSGNLPNKTKYLSAPILILMLWLLFRFTLGALSAQSTLCEIWQTCPQDTDGLTDRRTLTFLKLLSEPRTLDPSDRGPFWSCLKCTMSLTLELDSGCI